MLAPHCFQDRPRPAAAVGTLLCASGKHVYARCRLQPHKYALPMWGAKWRLFLGTWQRVNLTVHDTFPHFSTCQFFSAWQEQWFQRGFHQETSFALAGMRLYKGGDERWHSTLDACLCAVFFWGASYWNSYRQESRCESLAVTMRARAVEMHLGISQEPFARKFTGKMPQAKNTTHTLCEPAQSKCTGTFHKSHLHGNLQVKCRRPRTRPTLCAILHNQNAVRHFTRAILY